MRRCNEVVEGTRTVAWNWNTMDTASVRQGAWQASPCCAAFDMSITKDEATLGCTASQLTTVGSSRGLTASPPLHSATVVVRREFESFATHDKRRGRQ